MAAVIRLENLSKHYRLGSINRRMLYEDVQRWWARVRGQPDPFAPLHPAATLRDTEAREIWALQDVNLEIHAGDVVGIIGRNGSGKSTLLKILSRITAPTSGRALIKGRVASLLEVGTGFHPELTGRENVYMNATILGMTRAEVGAKFDEIVDFSGVEKFIDTPVKRYSSGMTVRLAFAVAAHVDPEILIIDEVLAVGDSAFQQKCLGKISTVAGEGRTVLFVSHNAAAVENLCTRGIVLEGGRILFDGSQSAAISAYTNSFLQPTTDLRHRPDRSGTGQVQVVAIEMRDSADRVINCAQAGQDVALYLFFETHDPHLDCRDLSVHINIRTALDIPVFTQANVLTGLTFESRLPPQGAFVCTLSRLPLPASSYRVSCLLRAATGGGVRIDLLDFAFEFSVESGDFFGSGRLPSVHDGVALVSGEWHLQGDAKPKLS